MNGSNWFVVMHRLDAAGGGRLGGRQAVAVPVLAARVGLAHEQHLLARLVARHQHEDRVFLIDAGQIEQVAVLPVFVVDVGRVHARRRAPEDRHRVGPEPLCHPGAAGLEVVLQRVRRRDTPQAQECQGERTRQRLAPGARRRAASFADE